MRNEGKNNSFAFGSNVTLSGSVKGDNNIVVIGNARVQSTINMQIYGDNNTVLISASYQIKALNIVFGSHIKANHALLKVGKQFSIEPGCTFLLYNTENKLFIGDDCLFSSGITIRCGEAPHLIFDSETGDYLDISEGVSIGDHVWIGERAYINKRAVIPSKCIVAACSVVTRKFEDENCVLGGHPARIVRKNVHWVRNRDFLEKDSIYKKKYDSYHESLNRRGLAASSDASVAASGPVMKEDGVE